MKGHGEVWEVIKTKLGGAVLLYDNYTSGGNSGSSVKVLNSNLLKLALE